MLSSRSSKSGTVLTATLIISLALTAVLAGLISWVNTESRVSRRNVVQVKAQYAAEATAEYALAQMRCVLQQKPAYADTLFTASGTPPTSPDSSVINSNLTSVLRSVTGSGTSGFATNIISSLATLQREADKDTSSRYAVSNTAVHVGTFSTESPLTVDGGTPLYATDPLRGKKVNARTVRLLASATVTDTQFGDIHTGYVEEILQVRDTPLVGYGIFYNVLMEIAPGADMQVFGPVHANRDIYAQSNSGLSFNGIVTTAGKLYHGRAPGSGQGESNGAVNFLSRAGDTLENMLQDSSWVDSRSSDWLSLSSNLWGDHVLTGASGVNPSMPANIPSYVPDDPATPQDELVNDAHVLIEPATKVTDTDNYPGEDTEVQKFVSQASLVLTVSAGGTVAAYKYTKDSGGDYIRRTKNGAERVSRTQLAVPGDLIVGGSASNKFYDMRRGKWINVVDIDVGKLRTLIENDSAAAEWTNGGNTFSPATEWNGVVFVEDANTSSGSIRLVNGRHLPNRPTTANDQAAGFTIATNVPMYVQGNYNADGDIPSTASEIRNYEDGEAPAALAADAITILSNAWDDANSNDTNLSSREAAATEVSAALITGVVATNKANNNRYSGGVENLPRFLETWSGVTLGYRGALIVLYESTHATEPWGSSNVYSPPNRVWGYSKMFEENNGPPLGRGPRTFRRLTFRKLTAAEYNEALADL